jgi:hypothetical protein
MMMRPTPHRQHQLTAMSLGNGFGSTEYNLHPGNKLFLFKLKKIKLFLPHEGVTAEDLMTANGRDYIIIPATETSKTKI